MRVLLVCSWFLKYAVEQAVGLRAAGAEVALLCRSRPDEFGGDASELAATIARAVAHGVVVFPVPGRISDARALPAMVDTARRVRRWQPDVVHAHDNPDPRLLLIASQRPCVLTVHDPAPHSGTKSPGRAQELVRRRWLKHADIVHLHSEVLVEHLRSKCADVPIAVVPHGTTVARNPLPVPDEPVVLLFGRLQHYKGIPVLLDAMEVLWRTRPETRLLIAGAGTLPVNVENERRIETRIGYVPEDELDLLFGRARLVVLPYLDATASGVGALAIGRGVPVVVTATGALPELVVDDRMIAVPGDATSLAVALLQALDHDDTLRQRVLARARDLFSWESVGRSMLRIYERLARE